ncbi:YcaO-like family protein [Catellatospora sp. TT07R-123]|uniref:YcaO-like family protein n=1 Tax=Catellatospora sp. TT07R-123 TaxID=2733863 RepID=UPI001BB3E305|nr:YcaO-like family protein [Catellatospora sp. TT07R-123]
MWNVFAGSGQPGTPVGPRSLGARGQALDDDLLARTVAVAEGLERYASRAFGRNHHDHIWALERHLPGAVIETKNLPRCSDSELGASARAVVPYDPDREIRWVRGFDVIQRCETWVPACMVNRGLPDPTDAERFAAGGSTGFAVHTDYREACIGALSEAAERDVAALTWLQRLSLPPLREQTTERLAYLLEWSEDHFISTRLFDATSDVGVPTVYALQFADHDPWYGQLVGAATGRSLAVAAEKAVLELISFRSHPGTPAAVPRSVEEITGVLDGARYMGQVERRHAFDFLATPAAPLAARRVVAPLPPEPEAALAELVARLAEVCDQAVIVNITTRELRACGTSAVAVVVPELQPLSLNPYAQFKAHPRLYRGPAAMGYESRQEWDLNPWPQPFP